MIHTESLKQCLAHIKQSGDFNFHCERSYWLREDSWYKTASELHFPWTLFSPPEASQGNNVHNTLWVTVEESLSFYGLGLIKSKFTEHIFILLTSTSWAPALYQLLGNPTLAGRREGKGVLSSISAKAQYFSESIHFSTRQSSRDGRWIQKTHWFLFLP